MSEIIHVVAYGARTPLGMDAPSSCAAVRASITKFEEHPYIVDKTGESLALAQDGFLSPDVPCVERITQMAKSALTEVCDQLAAQNNKIPLLPVYLGLPEIRPGWQANNAQAVCQSLAQDEYSIEISKIKPVSKGHAAGLYALSNACAELQSKNIDICIIAGVDSYIEFSTLEWLDTNKQLATPYHRGAFFPGEAAGAFAIASESTLKRLGLQSLATIQCTKFTNEEPADSDTVSTAEGLTECIRTTIAPLEKTKDLVAGVICDINGERSRAEEWGFTILRLAQAFRDPTDYDVPASCWGDVGAASGPLFVILAIVIGDRSKGAYYLVWNSSATGLKAATLLKLNQLKEVA